MSPSSVIKCHHPAAVSLPRCCFGVGPCLIRRAVVSISHIHNGVRSRRGNQNICYHETRLYGSVSTSSNVPHTPATCSPEFGSYDKLKSGRRLFLYYPFTAFPVWVVGRELTRFITRLGLVPPAFFLIKLTLHTVAYQMFNNTMEKSLGFDYRTCPATYHLYPHRP